MIKGMTLTLNGLFVPPLPVALLSLAKRMLIFFVLALYLASSSGVN